MIFRSDIFKIIKEAINPRINTDLARPLNQIIGQETQSIKEYLTGIVERNKDTLTSHVTWAKDVINSHTSSNCSYLINLLSGGLSPSIKSVQRGMELGSWINGTRFISVSQINPNKSIIIFDGITINNSSPDDYKLLISGVNANGFYVTMIKNDAGNRQISFSWQLIEFY